MAQWRCIAARGSVSLSSMRERHPLGLPAIRSAMVPVQKLSFSLSTSGRTGFSSFCEASSSSVSSITDPARDSPSEASSDNGSGAGSFNGHSGGGGGGGGGDSDGSGYGENRSFKSKGGLLGSFIDGWNDRVKSDPQFPFKVAMEQVVGVGACVIGDMASRPNFGLNELDFVFSTVIVGSILNFTLMYMLAPTSMAVGKGHLPSIFTRCPCGHMFENGPYSVFDRFGTFVYKGTLFAAVGFAAGLVGTFTSNFLISMRKKVDPNFGPQNKAPPTILNASTWALHMGLSSNLRYQAINGLEFAMAGFLPAPVFKVSVLALRTLNNILGGMSFVALARLTGSQKAQPPKASIPQVVNNHEDTLQAMATEKTVSKNEVAVSASVDGTMTADVHDNGTQPTALEGVLRKNEVADSAKEIPNTVSK